MTAPYAAMTRTFFAMRITEMTAPLLLLLGIFIIDSKMAKGKIVDCSRTRSDIV
jgi:hypothetical protein